MWIDPTKQAITTRISDAQTVQELEAPMVELIEHLQKPPILLNELWDIVNLILARVATIRSLSDLADGDDSDEQNPRGKIGNWFGFLAELLLGYNLHVSAVGILAELWNEIGVYQSTLNDRTNPPRHIYRAGIGMYLGRIYIQSEEPGAALWWLLHAHADDLLNRHKEKGGAARDMLRLAFGVRSSVFDYMEKRAEECLKSNEPHMLFAEHLVMLLSLEPEHTHLFAHPTSLTDFPIGRAYGASMYRRVSERPEGKPLEELARYLILLLAGWVPTKNTYHPRTRMDSDLIARYVREPEAISNAHGRAILAECKNIDETLGVPEVGYFLYRMHLTQVSVGIIFAKRNLTGRSKAVTEDRNAKHLIDLAFQRDGTAVIVIDLEDIKDIVEDRKTIWSLIDSRIVERRFGTANRETEDE